MSSQIETTAGISVVDRSELLHLLDTEIEHARAEASRGGWTSWAISAALIGVTVFGLRAWQGTGVGQDVVAKWVLLFAMPVDALSGWIWQWLRSYRSRSPLSYTFTSEASPYRAAAIWWAVRSALMIWVTLLANTSVSIGVTSLAVLYYGSSAAAGFGMFAASFFDIPILTPRAVYNRYSWVAIPLTWGAFAFVFWSFASTLPDLSRETTVGAIETAGAITMAQVLLFLLLLHTRPTPLVDRLVGTRRDLVLQRTELGLAARTAEVTLLGISGRRVLEEYLLRTVDEMRLAMDAFAHARIALSEAEAAASSESSIAELERVVGRSRKLCETASRLAKRARRRDTVFNNLIREIHNNTPALLVNIDDTSLRVVAGYADEVDTDFEGQRVDLERRAKEAHQHCAEVLSLRKRQGRG